MSGGWLSQLRKKVENGFPAFPVDAGVGGGGVIVVIIVAGIFIVNLFGANCIAIKVALQEDVVLLSVVAIVLLLDVQDERLNVVEVVVVKVVVVNCNVVCVGVVVLDVCVCYPTLCQGSYSVGVGWEGEGDQNHQAAGGAVGAL